jgi:uncharacterized membrane protein
MAADVLFLTAFVTAIGCGLMAGLFFVFSVAVMPGFGRVTAAHGLPAMQAINVAIINPVFLLVFLGTAATSAGIIIASLLNWAEGAAYYVAGGLFYLVGVILVTFVVNVPMNNAIAPLDATAPQSTVGWQDYLKRWTAWNHVRTIASILSTIAVTLGLIASAS